MKYWILYRLFCPACNRALRSIYINTGPILDTNIANAAKTGPIQKRRILIGLEAEPIRNYFCFKIQLIK